jgi:hypothetical protein
MPIYGIYVTAYAHWKSLCNTLEWGGYELTGRNTSNAFCGTRQ